MHTIFVVEFHVFIPLCEPKEFQFYPKQLNLHEKFHLFSVPPDILDYPTSTDMVVTEGSNVTLRCAATGECNILVREIMQFSPNWIFFYESFRFTWANNHLETRIERSHIQIYWTKSRFVICIYIFFSHSTEIILYPIQVTWKFIICHFCNVFFAFH